MSHARRIAILVLAWAPAVLIMAVIFLASSEHHPVIVTDPSVDVVMKKAGHFAGYALLGIAVAIGLTLTVDVRRGGVGRITADLGRWTFVAAWAIATAYACTDEFHQVFVSGRTPSVVDVGIDSLGAATGVALFAWWVRRRRRTFAEAPSEAS